MCGLATEPMDVVLHTAKDRNGATNPDRVGSCQRSGRSGRWQQWLVMVIALATATCGFVDGRRNGTTIPLVHESSNAVHIVYQKGVLKLTAECVHKAAVMERFVAQDGGDLLSTTLEIRDGVDDEGCSAVQVPVRVTELGRSSDDRDGGVPLTPGDGGPAVLMEPQPPERPTPTESVLSGLRVAPLLLSLRRAASGLERAPVVAEPDWNASRARVASSSARQWSRSVGGPGDVEGLCQRWMRDLAGRAMAQATARCVANAMHPRAGPPDVVKRRKRPGSLVTPAAPATPR